MKHRKIKLLSIIMGLLMLFTACGGNGDNNSDVSYKTDANYSANVEAEKCESVETEKSQSNTQNGNVEYAITTTENNLNECKVISEGEAKSSIKFNTEEYSYINENSFKKSTETPLSTFSIDVDTASYSNIRRFLMDGNIPPKDSVRIEEMINYFTYDYPQPEGNIPFSVNTEISKCPWNNESYLAMIGLQGKELETEQLPPSNLVFLMDVSGSMNEPNKLPLLKSAFKLLVNQLGEEDKISIVVYAGAAGVVLEPTPGNEKDKILTALERLEAGGSTAGGEGIKSAYKVAKENFIKNGNNRIILATDGDFNVGVSSEGELTRLIEEKRENGIFLSILGFGTGNYKDSKMELLADKGNGNYAYIDTLMEAKKVLVNEMGSTLFTIAKDVKLQVEFNPRKIKEYRLIGYENRVMNREDFDNDKKDAGELGAGHTVTAFYELIPSNSNEQVKAENDLKYQETNIKDSNEWMNVKLRYKHPKESESQLITKVVAEKDVKENPSKNFMFASSVAEFGLLLRDSEYKGSASYANIIHRAQKSKGEDFQGYRNEFIRLVDMTKNLK